MPGAAQQLSSADTIKHHTILMRASRPEQQHALQVKGVEPDKVLVQQAGKEGLRQVRAVQTAVSSCLDLGFDLQRNLPGRTAPSCKLSSAQALSNPCTTGTIFAQHRWRGSPPDSQPDLMSQIHHPCWTCSQSCMDALPCMSALNDHFQLHNCLPLMT